MAKIVFGCGYLGLRIARDWVSQGDDVHALTRSPQRAQTLANQGIRAIVGDLTQAESLQLPDDDWQTVLFAVGFDRQAGYDIADVYVDGLRRVLERLPDVERFIYISSTGVYGNTDGSVVDEGSRCQPSRAGGRACLAAEQLLEGHRLGSRTVRLRLAGIYGPGRLPRLAALQAGEPLAARPDSILNLIHVEDAARVALAVEQQAELPDLFVVSDGHPVQRADFYGYLSQLMQTPAPRFQQSEPGSAEATGNRDASDKRVCADKLRATIQFDLAYPTYREGLTQICREETRQ